MYSHDRCKPGSFLADATIITAAMQAAWLQCIVSFWILREAFKERKPADIEPTWLWLQVGEAIKALSQGQSAMRESLGAW